MLYRERRPAPPLDRVVGSIWICRNEPRPRALERILPTGAAQLIVNLVEDQTRVYQVSASGVSCRASCGGILGGISTRYQLIDTAEQEHVAGAVFRAAGAVAFFAPPASQLADRDVPLEDLFGKARANRLRESLLEAPTPEGALNVLKDWLLAGWQQRACHPAVAFALSRFHSSPLTSIQTVTDAISLSPKRFIERFEAEVGLTPKRYSRLLRFQRAVAKAHSSVPLDWAQLALECGYFDQAHFIHEFSEFSGITPGVYAESSSPFQNHVNFLQSKESAIS